MSELPVRIVKVGCSLFERRQLPEQLHAWLQAQTPAVHVLLAGAGELAESIRTWHARFQSSEENSHWLCIEALGITAQVLQQMLSDVPLLSDYDGLRCRISELQSLGQSAALVFDVRQFLRDVEPTTPPQTLPHGWHVTTDSIAARLAEVLAADELVLLKSRPCPEEQGDFAALVEQGYVDDYFPQIAARLKHVTLSQLGNDS
jgi:aspartokinase-like uncharacterized kinase